MVRLGAVRLRSCLFPERPPTMCGISQNELKVQSAAVDWLIPSPWASWDVGGLGASDSTAEDGWRGLFALYWPFPENTPHHGDRQLVLRPIGKTGREQDSDFPRPGWSGAFLQEWSSSCFQDSTVHGPWGGSRQEPGVEQVQTHQGMQVGLRLLRQCKWKLDR